MVSTRIAAALLLASSICAQAVPSVHSTHYLDVDSGVVRNDAPSPAAVGIPQVVWSKVVTVPGASWLRLEYQGVLLSGSPEPGSDGSFLRITSVRDGAVQTQHLRHVGEWRDTSAYFNGESVLVELLAQPGTGDNRIVLHAAQAGPDDPPQPDTICGSNDDRVLSSDPRVARNQPTGCTSWMINDCRHCFLTAGHCTGNLNVVQFNVPLSNSNGSINHPPPSDQYAVDASSMQSNGGQGVGNDWAYFGVFDNSNTGLSPYAAQGSQAFDVVNPPSVSGQFIRITGNGSTSSPVSPTWYLVQKTHAGPYASFSGTTVRYSTDTTGGNSGSPVILDGTNQAIGIHTHGGCTSTGGSNAGTGANLSALQSALANPQGICDCPELEFSFPNGLPNVIDPLGTTTLRITTSGPIALQAGTLRLNVSTGGAFQQITPTPISATTFDATFPATTCGTSVSYYVSAVGQNAVTYTSPENAPGAVHTATAAAALTTIRNYNFNTSPPGWTVANTALATGAWVRATPLDSRGPSADADGSGQCWVTGNANNEDVDGGPTVLTTETVDLSAANAPVVSYKVWFQIGGTTPNDTLDISASNNGGASWVPIESISGTNNWESRSIDVKALFGTPNQFKMRFSVADNPNNSVTEAALDAFRIDDADCAVGTFANYGAGCTNATSAPSLSALTLPNLGTTFIVRTTNLGNAPTAMILGLAGDNTPLNLPGFAAGCTLLARPDAVEVLNVFVNQAIYQLPLPNNQNLAGVQLHMQSIAFDSTWTMSDGGVATIN